MAQVTLYVPNLRSWQDKQIYVKKGKNFYKTPFVTDAHVHTDSDFHGTRKYIFLEPHVKEMIKNWSVRLFKANGCPKPYYGSNLVKLIFVNIRLEVDVKPQDVMTDYTVQGIYLGKGQVWRNWMSGLTLEQAKDCIKKGNSLTSSLRIVKVSYTLVE